MLVWTHWTQSWRRDAAVGGVGTRDDSFGALKGCTTVVCAISGFGLPLFHSEHTADKRVGAPKSASEGAMSAPSLSAE